MNKTASVIVSIFYFVFLALAFPSLQDASFNAVNSGNFTGAEASIIGNLPLIFLLLSVLVVTVVLLGKEMS